MDELYGPSLSGRGFVYDPTLGTNWLVNEVFSFSNPDLEPETSSSLSLGFNWEYLDDHSVDVTWYSIEIENVIVFPGPQDLVWADAAGEQWDPNGTRVERTGGFITAIHSYGTNANRLEASGLDVILSSSFDTGFGLFSLHGFYSKQLSFKENAYYKGSYQDTRKFPGQPDTRAQLGITWSLGDHVVSLVGSYIGRHSTDEDQDIDSGVMARSELQFDDHVSANLFYGYDAGDWGQIRIGANNVTDEDPVLHPTEKFAATVNLYDKTGRVIFVEYRNAFDW